MSKELFSLGEIYPSDFLRDGEEPTIEKVELKLIMDEGLVRLEKTAPVNKMYGKYWYRSGINSTMKDALKDVVDSITKRIGLRFGDIWLDIACNDGTLVGFTPPQVTCVGVDPAEESFKKQAMCRCDKHIQDYFTAEAYLKVSKKARVITSIAMFYDVSDPKRFIKDVYDVMEDDGLWVMQLSYSPLMIRQMAFDNICHEHIYYYSLKNLRELLFDGGFRINDCELNEVNGGSIRLYIEKLKDWPLPELNEYRINSLIAYEDELQINGSKSWMRFFKRVELLKKRTVEFIKQARGEGKSIWAYGASTKGNTLLQYFGLDTMLIDGIADRNPDKWGLRTIGTNIKIYSEEEMRKVRPDYLLILPWHFIKEFTEREQEYLKGGGKFIVPCPEFKII